MNYYCNAAQFQNFFDQRLETQMSSDVPIPSSAVQTILDSSASYIDSYLYGLWPTPAVNLVNPPTPPSLSYTAGGSLPQTTYYAVSTYSTLAGETSPSQEVSLTVPSGNILVFASPSIVYGPSGWNSYVGTAAGGETLQNYVANQIGTHWTEPLSGLGAGKFPPTVNTAMAAPPLFMRMTAIFAAEDVLRRRLSGRDFDSITRAAVATRKFLENVAKQKVGIAGLSPLPGAFPTLIASNDSWGKSQFDGIPFFDNLNSPTSADRGASGPMGVFTPPNSMSNGAA